METLYMVIPCYNEELTLPETSARLAEKLRELIAAGKISPDSRIMFVDDGSKDSTWDIISTLHKSDGIFDGLKLSRNRGHQNAVLAGFMEARRFADMAISMDADLQDDVDAIGEMVDKRIDGCDIVYGVRSSRKKDGFFKRFTAESYYRLISAMGVETVYNHADFRLMSRRALDALAEYREVNLFLRGIVPAIGFKTDSVYYDRGVRHAGESKYPLKRMLALAFDGITSFSVRPLRAVTATGALALAATLVLLAVFLIGLALGQAFTGYRVLILITLGMGGLILTGLGIVGEYIGKIYMEVKARPRYFIDSSLHRDERRGANENLR